MTTSEPASYLWDVIVVHKHFVERLLGHERHAVLRELGVAEEQWHTTTTGPQIQIRRIRDQVPVTLTFLTQRMR